jgi:general secretion pathway protein I
MKASMRHVRGFSLLEVIAAIMLLAIAFGALMEVAGGSIRLSKDAADHSQAALWARTLLDTRFAIDPVKPGVTNGQFDNQYRWQLDVTPWTAPGVTAAANANTMQMYRLDLDVMWGDEPFVHHAHFATLRIGSPNTPTAAL